MEDKEKSRKKISFRSQLLLFGMFLVLIVAVPVLVIEVQRPWQLLQQLIKQANAVIAEVKLNFPKEDLVRLNQFALEVNRDADEELENQLAWTFTLMIGGDSLLSKEDMLEVLKENEVETADFDYAKVEAAYNFWQEKFEQAPGVQEKFQQYKQYLLAAKAASASAGFEYDDLYIMTDNGKVLTFLIDGGSWWESTYPGLEYDIVENNSPYFRGYLQNGPGFATDPIHYSYGLFPKFTADKWGTWFSVWYAEKNQRVYNNFAMDFKADEVKDQMRAVASILILGTALVLLVIFFLANRVSRIISKPIDELIVGIKEIMAGNYDIQVKKRGSREFEQLIDFFNQMVASLKERLNMKQTLERLLSKELAERVMREGLVLGGQKANITILFTDFAGFSSMTLLMPAEQVVAMLNDYFSLLIPIIKKWGGFPDKYIGDAIVAIFGAPVSLENHAQNALACAIEMQKAMRLFNEQRKKEGKIVLEMRIGLNSGEVIAGAIGSDMKLEYTSIGEPTNLAQRMEALCQNGHILIAEPTYELVKDTFFEGVDFERSPQSLEVKGYDHLVSAYNIFVSNLQITKQPEKAGTNDYYLLEISNHHLKFFDKLEEGDKQKFTNVIKVEL